MKRPTEREYEALRRVTLMMYVSYVGRANLVKFPEAHWFAPVPTYKIIDTYAERLYDHLLKNPTS